jgi:hypothetical protein
MNWHQHLKQVNRFKEELKSRLPQGEYAMIQDEMYCTYATIHNGKGGLNPRQRYMNKMIFFRSGDNFKVTRSVARTDPNYQDEKYIELLLDIVNLAWQRAMNSD